MKNIDCIFFLLGKAAQTGVNFWGAQVDHLNITAVQAMVLNFLGEQDNITSHALGGRLQITSATMTGILDRLEKMELIERAPNPDDRRAILVRLTPKGSIYANEIKELYVSANNEFLKDLSDDEQVFLRSLLRRLIEK